MAVASPLSLFAEATNDMVPPVEAAWTKGVYHLYVVPVQDREALQAHLAEAGIPAGIHYPVPIHLQKPYEHLAYERGAFPVTERVASEIVSLAMFPQMTREQPLGRGSGYIRLPVCLPGAGSDFRALSGRCTKQLRFRESAPPSEELLSRKIGISSRAYL